MERVSGKVKWFNDSKGIGFIKREADSDVFVHYKSILLEGHKTLKKGQPVTFALTSTEFGYQAAEVRIEDVSPSSIPEGECQAANA
ncbi:cold-shock protein [Marinomonas pollencensis]|uniref:Putative cold-shock DNA-binding protein n=1 Tax=Marinomonas pollencensis TaxID=491954 RepID=A0A3E0DLS2_9GAMM|nr:cold shock domain-containing protein [Marinomonas pollencensis]REG82463.1 putative cold-shock DNA-binding protein [Marinomonas pollencensis]